MSSTNSSSASDPIATATPLTVTGAEPGLREAPVTETSSTQLTEYIDAAPHVSIEREAVTPDQLWRATNTLPNQDLEKVLGRSYQLDVFTWTSSAAGTDIMENVDIVTTLLAIPQIAEKVAYYKYFRCKAVRITLRLNATPWHYGMLVLSSTVNNSYLYHNQARAGNYQYFNNNSVLVQANEQKAVDYSIPWSSPYQWFDLVAETPTQLMTFRLTVGSALSMIGASLKDAQISVFANFVEPEVCFPVGNSAYTTLTAHSGKTKNAEAREKSKNNTMVTDLSSVLTTTMDIVKTFGEVAKVAQALACFDKPTALTPLNHYVVLPGTSLPHTAGLDTVVRMSADPEASAGVSENSMGDMIGNPSISQLVQTPGFVTKFSYSSSDAEGTRLFKLVVAPMTMIAANTGQDVFTPTPLWWYSNLFRYWRGGMKFHLQFVSSSFITSRVRLVWIPPGITVPATIADAESGDFISQVLEVTGSMEMDFVVPWVSDTLYRQIGTPAESIDARLGTAPTYDNGSIAMYLTAPIVSVDTVLLSTVNCFVFAAAAEDFQFSNFSSQIAMSGGNFEFCPLPVGQEQTLDAHSALNAVFAKPFAPIVESQLSVEFGLATAEYYADLVSLGKRYQITTLRPEATDSTSYSAVWSSFQLNHGDTYANLHKWITACHVNFRGSTRWKYFWSDQYMTWDLNPTVHGATETGGGFLQTAPTFTTSNSGANNFIEFEIPWMNNFPWRCRGTVADAVGINALVELPVTDSSVLTPIGKKCFSFGDDFAVGVFQAPPFMIHSVGLVKQNVPVSLDSSFVFLMGEQHIRVPASEVAFFLNEVRSKGLHVRRVIPVPGMNISDDFVQALADEIVHSSSSAPRLKRKTGRF